MPKSKPLTLAELSSLLPRIHATVAMLAGAARHATHAAPVNGRRKGRPGRPATPLGDKLVKALKSSKAGMQLGDLAKRVGASPSAVQYHLRKLRAEKRARVVGDRKLARWYALK